MHVGRTLALAERGDSRTLRRGRVHAVLAGRGRHWRIPRQGGRSMAKARKPEQLLGKLLEDIDIAMLTTIGRDGYLVSRPLSTQKSAFDGRRVWFFTEADSPKIGEIRRNPKVNLAYASKEKNTYVSIARVTKKEELMGENRMLDLRRSPVRATLPPSHADARKPARKKAVAKKAPAKRPATKKATKKKAAKKSTR